MIDVEMYLTYNLIPYWRSYNKMFDSCIARKDVKSALFYLEDMQQMRILANEDVIHSLMELFGDVGDIERVMLLYQALVKSILSY
jgi:pentatricopeptide repeat protein